MTQIKKVNKFWLALLAALLVVAALPATAQAQGEDLVRFRIINKADRSVTIRLYATDGSGHVYYMQVESKTTKSMSPVRGVYDYRFTACGIMVTGTVDISKPVTWLNPQCGDKGGPGSKAANTTDVGKEILNLAKTKLVNHTGTLLRIWFDGPFPYVFTLQVGETRSVSLLKGSYVWHHYACDGGEYQSGNFFANNTKTKIIECN